MKRSQLMNAAPAGRGLQVLVTSAMLSAVPAVILAGGWRAPGISPSAAVAAQSAWHDGTVSVLYTTSGRRHGLARWRGNLRHHRQRNTVPPARTASAATPSATAPS
jgi:hypothetical protein